MARRVLVVDDDALHRAMLRDGLEAAGFVVECLGSAFGVSAHARGFRPDLVLLDLNLPALTGDRLLPLLKRQPGLERCEVLLYSAADPDTLARAAQAAGADGWLSKGEPGGMVARLLARLDAPKGT